MPFLIPIVISAVTTAAEAAASESAVMFVADRDKFIGGAF